MIYSIVGEYSIAGIGRVVLIEFKEPQERENIVDMFEGTPISNGIVRGFEFQAKGEECLHKQVGMLLREIKEEK